MSPSTEMGPYRKLRCRPVPTKLVFGFFGNLSANEIHDR